MKSRIFNIMQYEVNSRTGEKLFSEAQIIDALRHKTIKRYAYICHDNDVYSDADEADDPEHISGNKKPRHWHLVLEMKSNQVEIGVIANWLHIADNFVNVAKGAGAFLDCVQYLTHEDDKQQGLGKRLYPDKDVTANFDFRGELDRRQANKLKYGKDLNAKDQMSYDVLYNGMTLRECEKRDPLIFMDNIEKFKKLRMEYISKQKPPKTRINYYVSGRGGVGKGLISRAIARNLFPQFENDEDIFFEVGAKGAGFLGYDGQPVIIWNDRRAYDLLSELNGRGNVFNVFDTHPTKQRQNVKYGSVNLSNTVNIVNSVQTYQEFLDGLAGAYKDKDGNLQDVEDKGQSYRRFPFIIPLYEEDFSLMLNKGFIENTDKFEEYIVYDNIRGNMQKVVNRCKGNEELSKKIQSQTVKIITDKHNEVIKSFENNELDEDKILKEFEQYGVRYDGFKPMSDEEEIPDFDKK